MPDNAVPADEKLLARAREGDQLAFRMIMERYEGKVAATVVGMLGAGPDADDVGQETFIRFFKAIENFRGDATLGTYLTRIAINQSLKALKRRKKWHQRFFSQDNEESRYEGPGEDGEETVERIDTQRIVRQALDQLTPDHRAVAVLRLIEGYSTKQTAALLEIPEGTVMSRLSRAVEKLGKMLGPVLNHPTETEEI
jgi:RNA polymerase sigma-70 factor (ECF subfamily)